MTQHDDGLGFFIGMKNALHIEAVAFVIVFLLCATVVNCSGIMNVFNLDAHGNAAERILK